jgi:hypothetical protein
MRSQVQVLAGPPPIVAGQSAPNSLPAASAAGLGRAGAARPSRRHLQWPRRGRPPGRQARRRPPTVVAHPAEDGPRGGCRHLALQPAPVPHRAAARDSRSARRPGLPGRSVVKRGRGGPAPTRRPGTANHLPLANPTSAALPASRPPRPSLEPSTAGSHRGLHPFRWSRAPGHLDLGPHRHRLRMGGDGCVRTDGGRHQTAGHRTGGHRTAGHRTPDGWTADGRAPDPLDDDPR